MPIYLLGQNVNASTSLVDPTKAVHCALLYLLDVPHISSPGDKHVTGHMYYRGGTDLDDAALGLDATIFSQMSLPAALLE